MTVFLIRRSVWFLFLLLIVILSITFYVYISFIRNNINDDNHQSNNLDRTIAVFDQHDIQSDSSLPSKSFNHVLYVISLDGKITAIDVHKQGRQLWIADTGSPLVNSTISNIEISHNSKSIRVIPSLIGGLYRVYDENGHMEPLPFDAESLLNTSFQLQDELVMTGGKDIDMIGLDLQTGRVIYSFSKNHVDHTTSDNTCSASILVIKRIRQTVRARCARNGYEKWNFSVSKHELMHFYVPASNEVVEEGNNYNQHRIYFEYQLQSGLILAFNNNKDLIWTSSINSPIAAVWELKNGHLKEKSLLKTRLANRLAFMGKFNSIPYVLISSHTQRQLIYHARQSSSSNTKRPVLTFWHKKIQENRISINYERSKTDQSYPLAIRQEASWDTIGYLELMNTNENIGDEEKYGVSLLILSNVGLCALIIILVWQSRQKPVHLQHQESTSSDTTVEYQLFEQSFQSRYALEYEHVRFLGRGGFGVVFEAINKLDKRRVAIKRVPLKKPSGKERALKEIRCLAMLNHPNLIQYYYAWDECPPSGWQDDIDKNNEITKDSLSLLSRSATSNTGQLPFRKLSGTSCQSSVIDFTFERSLNPHQNNEESNSSLFEHSYEESTENDSDDLELDRSKSSTEKAKTHCSITYFYFVMELCQTESLRHRLMKQMIKSRSEALLIFDQIIHGIEYIHSQKLIHRDLKPSNILFSMGNTVKIGDFGLVSAFGEDKIDHSTNNEPGGTILYMSPEQINRQSYNQKVDIYAIGIILFELLNSFSTQMERIRALEKIRLQTPIFPVDFECNQMMCFLIRWLLAYSPHDRPKACELRQDNAYQNVLKSENILC